MKKVVLLDGYNLMYRARYSGMNKGEYSTIFNFFRGLRPLIEKFDPDLAYFVLEGAPKKRLAADPDYKGQRVYNNDDNFSAQRKTIIKLLQEFFPIQLVKHDDFECDDVIGFLADKHKVNDKVTIISSDTDFIQYENLTQDIVLGWITGSLDVNAIQTANSASVAVKIAEYNAETEANGLPW